MRYAFVALILVACSSGPAPMTETDAAAGDATRDAGFHSCDECARTCADADGTVTCVPREPGTVSDEFCAACTPTCMCIFGCDGTEPTSTPTCEATTVTCDVDGQQPRCI